MKYRIKVIKYKNGNTAFVPEVHNNFCWEEIDRNGIANSLYKNEVEDRQVACARIEAHKLNNPEVDSVTYDVNGL